MDVFTDREDICGQSGSFMLRYNSFVKKNWSLIYIHGIAGIGKTTLIEKLMSELLEKENPNLVYYKMNKDRSGNLDREKEQT